MRILRHFVNLVENEYGIRGTCLLDVLDDTAGHCSDVGATMAANLSLVVQTTQRNADVFALQGIGNRLSQRRLTHARRTIQAENRRFQITS